ncbi:MAG: hypothetical protein QMC80_05095 [Thermoplasmatales archaeon]|nr:hypothetical protein [Thermoplasmatales archaeon]
MKKETSALTNRLEEEVDLLERYLGVLKAVMENEPIGIINLTQIMNEPQHKVRYALKILEQEGLIEATVSGAAVRRRMLKRIEKLKPILERTEEKLKEIKQSVAKIEMPS